MKDTLRTQILLSAIVVVGSGCHSFRPVTGPGDAAAPTAIAATTTNRIRVQTALGDYTTVRSPVVRNDSLFGVVREYGAVVPFGIALHDVRSVDYETVSAGKTVALTLFVAIPLAAASLLLIALASIGD